MTEGEAREKWCPFSRATSELLAKGTDVMVGAVVVNRLHVVGQAPNTCMCVGSGCMAWRWKFIKPRAPQNSNGYCGLAGKP